MKIAIRFGIASILGFGLAHVASVQAQELAQDAAIAALGTAAAVKVASQGAAVEAQAQSFNKAQADMPQQLALASMPEKKEAPKAESPGVVLPAIEPPALETPKDKKAKSDKDDKDEKGNIKVPDSVKSVVKRLNKTTDSITLEDLNSAREAVAKLDILIDIEKRLTDLASIRQERDEKTMVSAIPASALGMKIPPQAPPMVLPPAAMQGAEVMPITPVFVPPSPVEVTRIVGVSGNYAATVKVGEGKPTTVRQGDKLSDGSVVQSITNRTVTLLKDNKTRSVSVKDVAVVFSGR